MLGNAKGWVKMKKEYVTDNENYDHFRAELKSMTLSTLKRYQRDRLIFHKWAVRAIEDELKSRKDG